MHVFIVVGGIFIFIQILTEILSSKHERRILKRHCLHMSHKRTLEL